MSNEDQLAIDRYKHGDSIRSIAERAKRSFGYILGLVEASGDPVVQKRYAKTKRDLWGVVAEGSQPPGAASVHREGQRHDSTPRQMLPPTP